MVDVEGGYACVKEEKCLTLSFALGQKCDQGDHQKKNHGGEVNNNNTF